MNTMLALLRTPLILALVAASVIPARADVVDDWCNSLLAAMRANRSTPTRASRAQTCAMTQAAVYDAINGIQRTHRPYLHQPTAPAGASLEAAVSAAAQGVRPFTNVNIRTTNIMVLYDATLAAIPDGPAKTDGIAYGEAVANAIIQLRTGDGHDAQVPYTPGMVLGEWAPTPPALAVGLDPQWPHAALLHAGHLPVRTHRPPQWGPPPTPLKST